MFALIIIIVGRRRYQCMYAMYIVHSKAVPLIDLNSTTLKFSVLPINRFLLLHTYTHRKENFIEFADFFFKKKEQANYSYCCVLQGTRNIK